MELDPICADVIRLRWEQATGEKAVLHGTKEGKPHSTLPSRQKVDGRGSYNQRPAWLENAHQILDRAVFAAYERAAGHEANQPEQSKEWAINTLANPSSPFS